MVKRFDRRWTSDGRLLPLPQEDYSQDLSIPPTCYLSPGGRFHMPPLYDVMSVQPTFAAGQITRNKMKLALALSKERHYGIDTITPRHFIKTAEASGMPAGVVQGLLEELFARTSGAIASVLKNLPPNFPEEIAESISEGMMHRLSEIARI